MATRTLLDLRTKARRRANMENSTFVTDSEFNEYLNYSISELRDLIISKVGEDYYATSSSISLISGTESYSLPATFYKALWVELLCEDGLYRKMRRFEVAEQAVGATIFSHALPEIRYRLRENNIIFSPSSDIGGKTARLWYVPVLTELSADGDTLVGFNGWDEYIVLRSAIIALEKEEQDTSALSIRLEQLRLRIESMAPSRDQGQPMRVTDNESSYMGDGVWR